MRQVVLDTETTGLDPASGDRVLEVAAIEIFNFMPTGAVFHRVIDPERDVPEEAARIHGFTAEMLRGKPLFRDIADDLLAFLGDSEIIAHNAAFDFGFLDSELLRLRRPRLERARMVCSLDVAKRRYPGLPNSLDALCRRLNVDNSMRDTHNALLDVKLLSQVFLELMGGKQPGLDLAASAPAKAMPGDIAVVPVFRTPRPIRVDDTALLAHAAFVVRLKDPVWLTEAFSG